MSKKATQKSKPATRAKAATKAKARKPAAKKTAAKAQAPAIKTVKRHETDARAVAAYIMGERDAAPAINRVNDLLAVGILASSHVDAEQARVNLLAGGVRTLAVAIGLALPYIVPELANASAQSCTGYMESTGHMFGNSSGKVMKSQVNRVLAHVAKGWKPSDSSDNATVIAEALGFVRGELAREGTFTKWHDATPTQGKAGRKARPGKVETTGPATAESVQATLESLSPADQVKALEGRVMDALKALTLLAKDSPEAAKALSRLEAAARLSKVAATQNAAAKAVDAHQSKAKADRKAAADKVAARNGTKIAA